MIIVSACLAGVNCRHDGKIIENKLIQKLVSRRLAIPLCPEVLGGRPVPRVACEIIGGTAEQVLTGTAYVRDKNGKDVTTEIQDGVKNVMKAVSRMNVTAVILKTKSPTCGKGKIFDGTFTGKMIDGVGVLTAALLNEGVKVYTEEDCADFAQELLKNAGS
jgi:uncharacterized protein YbbK (DUF523 family)